MNRLLSFLQPENLLLSDKSPDAEVVISDFGLSRIFNGDSDMRTACGTPGYVGGYENETISVQKKIY